MFGWSLFFLLIAFVAGVFGFGGVAAVAVDFAKIVFAVALILFVISTLTALLRGRRRPLVL